MSTTKTTTVLRIRTRGGTKRVPIDDSSLTVAQLKSLIHADLGIPIQNQTLSTDRKLLEAKTHEDLLKFTDMSNHDSSLSDLNLCHGSEVYLFDTSSMDSHGQGVINSSQQSKMIMDNHNQKGNCSGTESSFNSKGSQNYEGAIINSGQNAGNYGGNWSAGASEQQHGGGGTQNSFNSAGQNYSRARINSGQNAGNYGGNWSAGSSERQHGGGGTQHSFNSADSWQNYSRARINSGQNAGNRDGSGSEAASEQQHGGGT